MSRLVVNIRGCNGSGKSTVPICMKDDPDMFVIYKHIPNRISKIGIATVFPSYGWIALGTYLNRTGGLDCLPNNKTIQKSLWYVLEKYPEYDIILEGIIASTVSSTYIDLFAQVQEKYDSTRVIILSFNTPVDVCIDRIYKRNGGKPINEKLVEDKYGMVQRSAKKFKDAGFVSLRINNEKTKKEDMLPKFLTLVEKYRKED